MSETPLFEHLRRNLRGPAKQNFAKSIDALNFLDLKLDQLLHEKRLSTNVKKFITSVRGLPAINEGFPLSSRPVREATAQAAIETMLMMAFDHPVFSDGHSRLRLLTIKANVGLVDIANPYFPAELVKRNARRLLSAHEIEALCFLDHAFFSPARGQAETVAHVHVHAAISLPETTWTRSKWVEALSPSRDPLNLLGDDVINISNRGSRDNPKLSGSDIAGLGWYLTKETCGANTAYQTLKGQKSESSFTDWTDAGILRQLELWSYIDFRQASWSQGESMGEARTKYRRRAFELMDYHEQPRRSSIDNGKVYDGWTRVWREFGNDYIPISPSTVTAISSKSSKPPSWRSGVEAILAHPGIRRDR